MAGLLCPHCNYYTAHYYVSKSLGCWFWFGIIFAGLFGSVVLYGMGFSNPMTTDPTTGNSIPYPLGPRIFLIILFGVIPLAIFVFGLVLTVFQMRKSGLGAVVKDTVWCSHCGYEGPP